MKKLFSALCAIALVFAASAPAHARDRHGYGYRGDHYDRGYYRDRGYHRDRDDHGDAVAAGIVGLALGAIIGSAASRPRTYAAPPPCYDCGPPPPPRCYDRCGGYYDQDYYAPPPPPRMCIARERQWDPYADRYLMIERPYPC